MFNNMERNFITQGFFSLVVLALLPNFPCLDLTSIKPWKVGQEDKLCDAGATMLLQLSTKIHKTAVEAGSDSTRLSTCFQKGVDVCHNDCFENSAVCKKFNFVARYGQRALYGQVLHLGYDPGSRTLCITGKGFQTRGQSTVEMIKDAVRSLDKDCKSLSPFGHKTIFTADTSDCSHDMAFSAVDKWGDGCKTKLIPDFSFYKWPEAGLLPDYKSLTSVLASLSSHPAAEQRCGWVGNMNMSAVRRQFASQFEHSALFDIVTPESNSGPGGQGGRISMEDQVKRWACFVELPARGYSGRVPYL